MKKNYGVRFLSILFVAAAVFCLMSVSVSAAEWDDRLAGTPAYLQDHVYLQYRGNGDCQKMTGNIMTLFLFVDDAESGWSQSEIDNYLNDIHSQIDRIKQAAQGYGAYPEFGVYYATVFIDEVLSGNDAVNSNGTSLLRQVGLTSKAKANEELEEIYGMDDAAIFLVVNKEGRACSYSATDIEQGGEYSILFNDPAPFWHELNHLFGARDFYYPLEIRNAVDLYLSGSIMQDSSSHIVDELTAYLIGWTDELYSCARGFLEETAYLTDEYLNEANRAQSITGWGTRVTESGTYVGDMVDGVFHGYGTFWWNDGTVYEGEWSDGKLDGYGRLTYADGIVRSGKFKDGSFA